MSAPTEFTGVTTVCKANIYFEGRVVSHTLRFSDGSRKTLGLIYPGSFQFNTGCRRTHGHHSWRMPRAPGRPK